MNNTFIKRRLIFSPVNIILFVLGILSLAYAGNLLSNKAGDFNGAMGIFVYTWLMVLLMRSLKVLQIRLRPNLQRVEFSDEIITFYTQRQCIIKMPINFCGLNNLLQKNKTIFLPIAMLCGTIVKDGCLDMKDNSSIIASHVTEKNSIQEQSVLLRKGIFIKSLFSLIIGIQIIAGIALFDYGEMILGIGIALVTLLAIEIMQDIKIECVPAVVYKNDKQYIFVIKNNFELIVPLEHCNIMCDPNDKKMIFFKNSYIYGRINCR